MEIPKYQPFYLETLAALESEIDRVGVEIPVATNLDPLFEPLDIHGKRIPNRLCAQPISGCDAHPDGSPSELTARRYQRYAKGGFGLIWFEATGALQARDASRLVLNKSTLPKFQFLLRELRGEVADNPVFILQLVSGFEGRADELSDFQVDELRDSLIEAACLAAEAGFDGVDISATYAALAGTLLSATNRSGRYGGSFENRSRFLLETLEGIRKASPSLLLATRLCAYTGVRDGFGVSKSDYRKTDLTEPLKLVESLYLSGIRLLNITSASPNLRGDLTERSLQPFSDSDEPDEHPLTTLERQLHLARSLNHSQSDLVVVGSGFSWLRQFTPHVAVGAIENGWIAMAGLGRGALAYPDAPNSIYALGKMEAAATCMRCNACSVLLEATEPVGCVIRDAGTYSPVYQNLRRFDVDQLLAGASRCHFCESAPCISADPTRTDIPAFIRAFLDGDESKAYELIRKSNPLPELTSQLSPAWLETEGACIETTLTGRSVPILDLQYTIAWRARQNGLTGTRIPQTASGKKVAIVGGGPTGISAASRLVEFGHEVDLFEHSDRLGGAPSRVIPASRLTSPADEIEALLAPAIAAKRLKVFTGQTLGTSIVLEELLQTYDAVLLAIGVWKEASLDQPLTGVMSGLDFLEAAKNGTLTTVPSRVAILAGGDSAMDAAKVAQTLGAREIFILFGGPRSEMHWHMPESWFASQGVHAMMEWQPLGYSSDAAGRITGIQIRHTHLGVESSLAMDFVIEAMGLSADGKSLGKTDPTILVQNLKFCRTEHERLYAAGGMTNGGASVGACIADGLAAADAIHHDLVSGIFKK